MLAGAAAASYTCCGTGLDPVLNPPRAGSRRGAKVHSHWSSRLWYQLSVNTKSRNLILNISTAIARLKTIYIKKNLKYRIKKRNAATTIQG